MLYEHDSLPLAEVIRLVNKYSNNVMARHLMLTLGVEKFGPPATIESGRNAIRAWLASRGIDMPGFVLDNGSGLSRAERVTARGLGEMLDIAWHSPFMPEFAASLPLSATDGTLRNRFKSPGMQGRIRLKTGHLDNVQRARRFRECRIRQDLRGRDHGQSSRRTRRQRRGRACRADSLGVRPVAQNTAGNPRIHKAFVTRELQKRNAASRCRSGQLVALILTGECMKRAIMAATLLALGSGAAYAQSPENDEGLYIGGGVGQFDIEIDGLDGIDEAVESVGRQRHRLASVHRLAPQSIHCPAGSVCRLRRPRR